MPQQSLDRDIEAVRDPDREPNNTLAVAGRDPSESDTHRSWPTAGSGPGSALSTMPRTNKAFRRERLRVPRWTESADDARPLTKYEKTAPRDEPPELP
jgi:hypothetical protein